MHIGITKCPLDIGRILAGYIRGIYEVLGGSEPNDLMNIMNSRLFDDAHDSTPPGISAN